MFYILNIDLISDSGQILIQYEFRANTYDAALQQQLPRMPRPLCLLERSEAQ